MSESKKEKRLARTKRMIELYQAGETLEAISEQFGISRERVRQILDKAGCPRRPMTVSLKFLQSRRKRRVIPEETLRELYIEKKFGIGKISRLLRSNYKTIVRHFDNYGIKRRSFEEICHLQSIIPKLTFSTLRFLYIEEKLTVSEIAGRFGYSEKEIKEKLKKCEIRKV